MNDFVLYGQWVVVVISLLGVALVSSTKHNTRLSGYIVTALGRLSGAILFIFLDLYAFVLVNIIHIIISLHPVCPDSHPSELGELHLQAGIIDIVIVIGEFF